MYMAMAALGHAAESRYAGPPKLDGDVRGASVLVLGAGVAGMVAAMELRRAGYRVELLEYNGRAGGRTWTIRGGDRYAEMGGAVQDCTFDPGLYLNPGPWRIPYHHRGLLDYCKRLGVALEPFVQVNHNAYLHGARAFGGKPQRYRAVQADFHGTVADMLAKAVRTDRLGGAVTAEDTEVLLAALRSWGALDRDYRYQAGEDSSERRGWDKPPGGGLDGRPVPSQPVAPSDLLQGRLWRALSVAANYDYQTTLFQPVGGMDAIARAMQREVAPVLRLNTKVTSIRQDGAGVTADWQDTASGAAGQSRADWCICAIPLPILSQIELTVSPAMAAAIASVPYAASVKIGLQFRRRFWEEDEAIYGGISYTDLPISLIGYPASGYHGGQGRPARRLRVRPVCLRVHRPRPGGACAPRRRVRVADPPAIRRGVRDPASPSAGTVCPGHWAATASGPMRRGASIMTTCARWTAGSCWPASMPRMSRPGRRARCSRRWMP